MTREIKFRAWDGFGMHYEDDFYEIHNKPFHRAEQISKFLDAHYACDLSQFTGLLDKHGKEIYEGDIFNYKRDKAHPDGGYIAGTSGFHPESAEVVRFEKGCFLSGNDYLCNRLFWYERHNWQLIGNIYENPGLLKC